METWDNLDDDALRAMSPGGLQIRICLFAIAAADRRDADGSIAAALDRATRIWRERGRPMPLSR